MMKTPPASVLLKKAAKIDRGSGEPKDKKVGKITQEQLRVSLLLRLQTLMTLDLPMKHSLATPLPLSSILHAVQLGLAIVSV